MKKRILSVLLGCSLLFGTVFANAASIDFEDLEQSDRISHIETDDATITYEELEAEEDIIEENIIQDIDLEQNGKTLDSPLATENQYVIDTKNELYPETFDSESETVEQSTVSQILKQPILHRSFMSARMASTVIDLTDLAAGDEISHDCNLYLNTQYDTIQHWKECSVCGKNFNITNHSYKDNGWTGGSANNCSESNVHQFVCSCGYGYNNSIGRKEHIWGDTHYQIDWYCPLMKCTYCRKEIHVHDCKKADGSFIDCSNPGTCVLCGHTYVAFHRDINAEDIGPHYCFKCGRYLGTMTAFSISNPYEGRCVYSATLQVPEGTVFTGQSSYNPDAGIDSTSLNIYAPNGSTIWTGENTIDYSLHEEYKTSSWAYFWYTLPDGAIGYIRAGTSKVTPESTPPVISSINRENLAYSDGWVTNQRITISGTENYCNTVYITMEDADGNKYLNNVKVNVSNKNWNYVFYPAIEADETGLEFTVTVSDQLGNVATQKFIEYKTDMKPPTVVSAKETTKEWSKTKDFTIDATDFGVKNVSVGFNDTKEYQLAEQQDNNFVRPYTFTGDVYGSTVAAVYVKDSIGNTTTQFITVYNMDNTAPTITNAISERETIRSAVVTVTANDINTKLNASGSGVTGYAITQDKTEPNINIFQTSNKFNLTKSGTWYVWAIDAVGNISAPVAVEVKIEYTVSLDPNGGTLTGDASYQVISGEEITIPKPVMTGYTFTGWSVKGEGSSVDGSKFTMGSEDAEITAQWKINQYEVTYIDKTPDGKEIGRTTKYVDYNTLVKGSDIGDSVIDNAYHNQYRYVSDTSATVTTEGAVVYRVFEFCETEKGSHLTWNDNNDADGLRPEKYKLELKQNGKVIDEIELPSNQTVYTFDDLPKYDTDGNPYYYEVETIVSDRYKTNVDEDGNLIVEDYQPANFSVIIPKKVVLDGETGNADYSVSVNGTFYYNDSLSVIPESSLTLNDRSNISSMKAIVSQQKTGFTKEDGVSNGITIIGNISADRELFAGSWQGNFNFDIKFTMSN